MPAGNYPAYSLLALFFCHTAVKEVYCMLLIEGFGHVTKDPVIQNGQKSTYLRLNVMINYGFGDSAKEVLVQYTFFGEDADRIVNAKVKKGSGIQIYGEFDEIGAFVPEGKQEYFMFLKCLGKGWSYLNTAKKDQNAGAAATGQLPPPQGAQPQPAQVPQQVAATPAAQQVPTAPAQPPIYQQQPVYQQAAAQQQPVPQGIPPQVPQAVQQPDQVLVAATVAGVAGYDASIGETEDLPF